MAKGPKGLDLGPGGVKVFRGRLDCSKVFERFRSGVAFKDWPCCWMAERYSELDMETATDEEERDEGTEEGGTSSVVIPEG